MGGFFTSREQDLLLHLLDDNLAGLKEAKEGILEDQSITSADELLSCMASVDEEFTLTEKLRRKVQENVGSAGDASTVSPL